MITRDDKLRSHLDRQIEWWHKIKNNPETAPDIRQMAEHYIDAYQSVRAAMLGEALTIED